MQSEKSDGEGRWVSRGLDYSPLASRGPERWAWTQSERTQCKSSGPRRGRKVVAGQRSLERHPRLGTSRLRPRGGDLATTPRPRGPRRHPFPRQALSPGAAGAGSAAPPYAPALPGPSLPARCGAGSPGQVPDTHVSRGSSGSSPARCSPTHSRPKEPSGIRVARGPAGRNTWDRCARNRKRPLAPPPGGAGACLGCRRFGPLVVLVEAWGSSSETHAGGSIPWTAALSG